MGMTLSLLAIDNTKLENFLKDSDLLDNEFSTNRNWLDIGKSWDAIIFLLTGKGLMNGGHKHKLSKVFFSGQIVDQEQDFGYGAAHYLTPEQVKELQQEISQLTNEELKKRYNFEKMNDDDVYPANWDNAGFDYLMEEFEEVKKLYLEAKNESKAIITILSNAKLIILHF